MWRVTLSVGHQRILARHVGLAPEVQHVGETVDAGVEALVAAGMDAEEIAGLDRMADRKGQHQRFESPMDGMRQKWLEANWREGQPRCAACRSVPRAFRRSTVTFAWSLWDGTWRSDFLDSLLYGAY
jgi:hypothetical protein